MGAIFGWAGTAPLDARLAHERLAHRAPAFQSFAVDQDCALAVVAREPGEQHAFADGVSVVLDGHVYGVDGELQARGSEPRSAAQQLLHAYLRLGPDGLSAVDGEYAVAIRDSRNKRLLLGRDRTGARPLYLTTLPDGTVFFASEYKALLAADACDSAFDPAMVQRLQQFKHLPSDRTLMRSIQAIPPGTLVDVSRRERVIAATLQRPQLALVNESQDSAAERISAGFMSSMQSRLDDTRRVGVALSGGIDSIAIAFAFRKFRPDQVLHTFTAGSDSDDPEVRTAALVSERLGAVHHPVYVSPADMSRALPDVVWHAENPIARSEIVQFFNLGKAAKPHVDVLLTGMGADGLYAGMPSDKVLWLYEKLPPLRRDLLQFYSAAQSGRVPESFIAKLMARLYFRGSIPPVPRIVGAPYDQTLPELPPMSPEFLNSFLCTTFFEGLAQRMPKVERTLSASGIEVASPYFDRRVVDTAFTIPIALKIRRGKEKYILRRAMRSLVTPGLLEIPKFPMRMKYNAEFADHLDVLADKYLSADRVLAQGLFIPETLKGLRRYRDRGRYHAESAMRLWTAVVTQIWGEQFVTGRGARLAHA